MHILIILFSKDIIGTGGGIVYENSNLLTRICDVVIIVIGIVGVSAVKHNG
jgi:hypothetical protein